MNPEFPNERLLNIFLHKAAHRNWTSEVRDEYETAVRDLLADNFFHLCKNIEGDKIIGPVVERGPYNLHLSVIDNRLRLDIRRMEIDGEGKPREIKREEVSLPMTPFRGVIKDYYLICESYFNAIKSHKTPQQIETVDMARRGVHNDGAEQLMRLLKPRIDMDFGTARRLFTLLAVLHFGKMR